MNRCLISSIFAILVSVSSGFDETLVEHASGAPVVEAVCTKIDSACIFQDDKELLRRISYVETSDGLDNDTFTSSTHKGIWKMDETMFTKTRSANMKILSEIKTKFQVDWLDLKWQDLQKPFYAGLAVRLYLYVTTSDRTIPRELNDQAQFWKSFYNPMGNEQNFINEVANLKKGCSNGLSDLVFLVDSSGSIGTQNFLKTKKFLKDVIETLNVGSNEKTSTRVAVVSFGNNVKTEFQLDRYTTVEEYHKAIDGIPYMNSGTNTHLALKFLVEQAFTEAFGARHQNKGVPKLGIILTDGMSSQSDKTLIEAARVHAAGINLVSVGIGQNINDKELTAMASEPSCRHKFHLTGGFAELGSITDLIEEQSCEAPINLVPDNDSAIGTQLPAGGIRHCKINVTKNGTTVTIHPLDEGIVSLYLSRSVYPSPANYDKRLRANSHYPAVEFISGGNVEVTVYCMIEGDKEIEVNISIECKPGNQDPCKRSNPCQNGGECKNVVDKKYECICPHPYAGKHCEYELDYCSVNRPCLNGGVCISLNSSTSYECQCAQNFTGVNCEIEVHQGFNCQDKNPCTRENILAGKFYFPHEVKGKFVQCSEWGQCFEMNCPPGLSWDPNAYACTYF